ncbi:MAG: ATP-binding cassette domain-containing protein [Candidatus Altiarchaeota archaeon]
MDSSLAAVTVSNLTKRFGELIAVNDISFNVPAGGIFAFLGPNGAGKSTTIKMLITLLSPTSGSMKVNGFDCRTQKDAVRKSLGIVFQDQSIDEELTAYENMDFHGVIYGVSKEVRKTRIKSLLELVDLWDRRDEFVKNFSGGMKRRLEIARGLVHHPKILFLDEPTIGLDPQTRNNIWEHIKELNKKEGITIFFTTHYIPEAESVADEVAIIDKGKIVADGTVEDLRQQSGTDSLEKAFLSFTGRSIREETGTTLDRMRRMRRVMRR